MSFYFTLKVKASRHVIPSGLQKAGRNVRLSTYMNFFFDPPPTSSCLSKQSDTVCENPVTSSHLLAPDSLRLTSQRDVHLVLEGAHTSKAGGDTSHVLHAPDCGFLLRMNAMIEDMHIHSV
jgi:hypothetical protein